MLEPRRLLTFREVARRGSFSRAAEALALTQPAVSQQVAALEREVGASLLDRGPGGLALTETGELLLAHADALSDRLRAADAQLAELAAAREARLVVGAYPSALATIVPDAIARSRAAWDREDRAVTIEALELASTDAAAAIRDGRLHVAVCFEDAAAPPREHPDARRHEIAREPMDAAVGPDHPLVGRRRIALAALADDTWTAPSREHLVRRACVAAGFEPRIDYVTRDPLAIAGIIRAGLGVSLTPRLLAGRLEGVRTIALTGDAPSRRLYALTPAVGGRERAVRFVEALRAAAKERMHGDAPASGRPGCPVTGSSRSRPRRS
jgi:DNA-binding transcriptional LysR family regulator